MKVHMTQAELQVALAKHFNDHVFGDELPEYEITDITNDQSATIGGVHLVLSFAEPDDE